MRNTALMVIVALIVGGLVGYGVGNAQKSITTTGSFPTVGIGGGPRDTTNALTSKATNLRLSLNKLLTEHGVLATLHLQAIYDGKDTTASMDEMDSNSEELGKTIESVYGNDAKDEFMQLWKKHMDDYVIYTQALKSKDTTRMNQAKDALHNDADLMGKFFNKLNSHISTSDAAGLVREHVDLTMSIIDAYAAKDQVKMVKQIDAAVQQAGKFADFLASGIVADKPDLFK